MTSPVLLNESLLHSEEADLEHSLWGCIRVSGGWGEPSLQEFDYNPFTKDQVFIKINDF